mmetsp:Transcript_21895/g.32629  ORF Transcript_21895/g.32629 Transcript_21895/m.32629 type:complete len:533 (-) Transcript_21895:43-1641(-)
MQNPSFLKHMSATSVFNVLGVPGSYCSPSCVIIDCRSSKEYQRSHIRGAINLPAKEILDGETKKSMVEVPDIPHLPPAKKSISGNSSGNSFDRKNIAAFSKDLAERIYTCLWERFSHAYFGCYMPSSLVLYTSEASGEKGRDYLVTLAILLRRSRRGVLHDISIVDKGYETFAKIFPFQCRSHLSRRVFSGPFLLYPTQILPFVYLGSKKNSSERKQIEQLGISYIVNCDGVTRKKLPMVAYFDLKLTNPKVELMFCSECGTRFRTPVKFCSSCGVRVIDKTLPRKPLLPDFRKCIEVLDRCRRDAGRAETGRNILVHGETGNNMAAAVTIAFLMFLHRHLFKDYNSYNPPRTDSQITHRPRNGDGQKPWTLKRVLKFVRKHRPSVDIDSCLLQELTRFETSLIEEAKISNTSKPEKNKTVVKLVRQLQAPKRDQSAKSNGTEEKRFNGIPHVVPHMRNHYNDPPIDVEVKHIAPTRPLRSILRRARDVKPGSGYKSAGKLLLSRKEKQRPSVSFGHNVDANQSTRTSTRFI